jgi:hypothetical protein
VTASVPQSKKLVIGAMATAGTLAAIGDVSEGQTPKVRILLGATAAAVVLTLVADFGSPEIASAFAVLILLASILATAPAVWGKLNTSITRPGK